MELAYFTLPADPEDGGLLRASWTPDDLDDAVERAQQIVRDIRSGVLPFNEEYPRRFRDDFAVICRTAVHGGDQDLEEEGLGE